MAKPSQKKRERMLAFLQQIKAIMQAHGFCGKPNSESECLK